MILNIEIQQEKKTWNFKFKYHYNDCIDVLV